MYGFSEEYLLDERTLEEVLFYYDDGIDFEFLKADILIAKLAEAITGRKIIKDKRFIDIGTKPDLKKFNRIYSNKIIKPKR